MFRWIINLMTMIIDNFSFFGRVSKDPKYKKEHIYSMKIRWKSRKNIGNGRKISSKTSLRYVWWKEIIGKVWIINENTYLNGKLNCYSSKRIRHNGSGADIKKDKFFMMFCVFRVLRGIQSLIVYLTSTTLNSYQSRISLYSLMVAYL